MKEFLGLILVVFLLGLDGCAGRTANRLSYCLIGEATACADLRDAYKLHRKPVTP